jgi:peroxiredoxin
LLARERLPKLGGVQRPVRSSSWLVVGVLVALGAWACGSEPAAPPAAEAAEATATADVEPAAAREDPPQRRERPLPAFSGWTLDGGRVQASDFLGKRLLLFFFNPEVPGAGPVADAVARVSELRGDHNFEVLGVGVGSERERLLRFAAAHRLEFRIVDDSGAAVTRKLGLQSPLTLAATDAEGFLLFGISQFPEGAEAAPQVEMMLRSALRLPASRADVQPVLGTRPEAPDFRGVPLDGKQPFHLAAQRGRPVVLIFFLHTCPHCHGALGTLKDALAALPEAVRPVVVGVEITGRSSAVRHELETRKLDFLPVLFDEDARIREAYGVFAGVPEIFLIDAEGRIVSRSSGWEERRDPPLMRMRLARLAGTPVPMLLRGKGYSGSEVCGVCHEAEYETWMLTTHASAFDTLVKHGAERDAECVGCHVVGHGEPGGYADPIDDRDLEDVGCESCHGRGGPHLSPAAVGDDGYAARCGACHDAKHSLGFEYASFLPVISHASNAHLLTLPLEEKQRLLAERGRPRDALLPTGAAYVGSAVCESCHPAEYATWSGGAHAAAFGSLEARGEADNADCRRCHTTGYERPGGFPTGGEAGNRADLARVGCESCHGPGGSHVADGAVRRGSIVSLGDKCDSCVILQICGSCHDSANDPGFEFEVQEKIEKQRHGTIEPGGAPKASSARLSGGESERLAAALRALGAGS